MLSTRARLEAKQVTATRFLRVFTSFSRLARTVASEPASPSTKTLVLSHTMASAPSSPMRFSVASSVSSPSSGSGSIFQSPVWNTVPNLVRIASAFGSRIECVMVIISSSNGPTVKLAAERDLGDRHRVEQARLAQLALQHRGGERRGIDRRLEPRPQVGDGAEMVLVGMGDDDADQVLAALLDEGGIGHHDLDARHRVVAEGDAEIDHQPLAGMAVEIEVHADLAGTAQGEEQELVVRGNCHERLRRHISSRPSDIRSGSMASNSAISSLNTLARPPVATTFIGSPYSARMRLIRLSISPT